MPPTGLTMATFRSRGTHPAHSSSTGNALPRLPPYGLNLVTHPQIRIRHCVVYCCRPASGVALSARASHSKLSLAAASGQPPVQNCRWFGLAWAGGLRSLTSGRFWGLLCVAAFSYFWAFLPSPRRGCSLSLLGGSGTCYAGLLTLTCCRFWRLPVSLCGLLQAGLLSLAFVRFWRVLGVVAFPLLLGVATLS